MGAVAGAIVHEVAGDIEALALVAVGVQVMSMGAGLLHPVILAVILHMLMEIKCCRSNLSKP